jgi:trehalose/maltose hydrolase-like predicted phosphorylase
MVDANYRPSYLGNGLLGQAMDAGGLGMTGGTAATTAHPSAASGAAQHLLPGPQPATMAGLYYQGKMVSLPPLFPLAVELNGQRFGADPAALSRYQQTLDLRHGVLTTKATWNGAPVEVSAFLSRETPRWAVCRVVAPSSVTVRDESRKLWPASGAGATSSPLSAAASNAAWMAAHLEGLETVLLPGDGTAISGASATTLVAWLHGLDGLNPMPLRGALTGLQKETGADSIYASLLKRHEAAWEKLWASDIEIEGNPADRQIVHALMYQVFSSVREGVKLAPGFPPMGLSNPAAFDGHVFWDADTWIFPALLPLHPELARTILDYRLGTLPGAKANAAAEKMPGASYAWESADTGREVATLDTRHGRHVTADVALAHWHYYLATGDRVWLRKNGWPVLSAAADYWTGRAVKNARGQYEIRRVSTPDENAGLVDNSAWTNFSARENLRVATRAAGLLGMPANPRWQRVADGLLIPRDASGMILEYSGHLGRPAKQADTLLLLFPGGMSLPRAEQERTFRYYVDRTIKSGPAMTESVHAVIAARLGQPEEAYRRFRQSVDPFARPPFLSFSEKRTRDHMHFLTGAAGSLQAVLYGFAGLRLEDSPRPVFQPRLPAAWSGLTLRNFQWRGKRYDVVIRGGQPARVTPRP